MGYDGWCHWTGMVFEFQPVDFRRQRTDENHPQDTYTIKVEPLGYLTGIEHSGRVSNYSDFARGSANIFIFSAPV